MVKNPLKIRYYLEKAYWYAIEGRKGPVWLDIPLNIQSAVIETNNLEGFTPSIANYQQDNLQQILDMMQSSERPVFLAGSGLRSSNMLSYFRKLIRKWKCPVISATSIADIFPNTEPMYMGNFGVFGGRAGNYIVQNNKDLRVLYTTSDDFRKDYTGIANKNENSLEYANDFKEKYRSVDVLIIDDIQYLVGAEKTQEEFFHTFNDLHGRNKQIIISSDRSPEDLKILEERLRSRFAWGLPVDIYPPDFDLRCRIIRDKIKHLTIADKMTDEAIEFIANNCYTDVRSLEGAINRLVAYTAMCVPDKIDLEFTNCIAQISVSNPSFAPFKFVSFEAISTTLQDLDDLKLTYFFYDSDGMTEQEVLNELSLGIKFCSSFVPNQLENAYLNRPGRLKIPKDQLRHYIHPDDIQKYEDLIIDTQYVCTGIQAQYLLLTNNLLSIRVLPDAFII